MASGFDLGSSLSRLRSKALRILCPRLSSALASALEIAAWPTFNRFAASRWDHPRFSEVRNGFARPTRTLEPPCSVARAGEHPVYVVIVDR